MLPGLKIRRIRDITLNFIILSTNKHWIKRLEIYNNCKSQNCKTSILYGINSVGKKGGHRRKEGWIAFCHSSGLQLICASSLERRLCLFFNNKHVRDIVSQHFRPYCTVCIQTSLGGWGVDHIKRRKAEQNPLKGVSDINHSPLNGFSLAHCYQFHFTITGWSLRTDL